jgi:hypothetical protein
MSRKRMLRLFWIGAAAIRVVAALIGVVAVVAGSFDETDGKILATLGTALLAGAVATAGSTLVEARLAPRLGLVAAVTAPVWFAIAGLALWQHFDGNLGKTAVTGYIVLTAELVVVTARGLVGRRRLLPLFGATAACIGVAATLTVAVVWREHAGGGTVKAIAAFWILGVLGYLLIPVARRLSAASAVGEPRKVDLTAGVEVGRTHVRVADSSPSGRERLYLVVSGQMRIAGVQLRAGEAALVPGGTAPEIEAGSRVVTIEAR